MVFCTRDYHLVITTSRVQWNAALNTSDIILRLPSVTTGVSVYSADVDSRCLSPHIGCRWLAAVLFDTYAAAAPIVCKQT